MRITYGTYSQALNTQNMLLIISSCYSQQAKDDNLTFVQNLDFLIKH